MSSTIDKPLTGSAIECIDGACVIDSRGEVVAADGLVSQWLKVVDTPKGSISRQIADIVDWPQLSAELERVLGGEPELAVNAMLGVGGREPMPALVRIRRLEGADGPLVMVTFHAKAEATPPPALDALTGLPDRRAVADQFARWHRESSGSPRFALLFLDLDDFKRVNDQHGHHAGDLVLQELASRWLRCVREGDLVARYGGDEFVVLLKDAAAPGDVEPVIRRLHEATEESIDCGQRQLQMTCTIGVAISRVDGGGIEELIAAADRDMYAQKRSSRTPSLL